MPSSRPVLAVTINNDNFLRRLDGGLRSSQVGVGTVFPLMHGLLKNGSLYLGANETTFTGGNGMSIEPDHDGKIVNDGYQAPGGELDAVTTALYLPLNKNGRGFDVGLRSDLGAVTGEFWQNLWHVGAGAANYIRSPSNHVAKGFHYAFEPVAVYHFNENSSHWDPKLLGGAAIGNGYNGAMAGAEIAFGSKGARSLPGMTHSAQFGNSNTPYLSSTEAPVGAFRVAGFVKIYGAAGKDYRTQLPANNPLLNGHGPLTIIEEKISEGAYGMHGVFGTQVTQNWEGSTIIYHDTLTMNYPGTLLGYKMARVNWESGLDVQYKVSSRVDVRARATLSTNPVRPIQNTNFSWDIDKELQRLDGIYAAHRTAAIGNTGSFSIIPVMQRGMEEQAALYEQYHQPGTINKYDVQGEIGVNIALGKLPTKSKHR